MPESISRGCTHMPESIPVEYALKHGMDFESAQEMENARKQSMHFKFVRKELKQGQAIQK